MTLKDITSKLGELEAGFKSLFSAKAEDAQVGELKTQLANLQALVDGALATADAKIVELTSANETLSASASATATKLNEALAALKLEAKADATDADKILALQDSVATTLAKLSVPQDKIPVSKPGAGAEKQSLTSAQFMALGHSDRMAFVRSGGKITE